MARTPIGYQNTSEGYLQKAGQAFGSMGAGGQALTGIGQGYARQYRQMYRPLQQRIIGQAELNGDDLVDQAAVDVTQSFDKARGIQARNLSRMGIDPSSGRWRGLQQQLALAEAAAEAGARTRARRQGRRESFGRMMQAAGLGQQLPGYGIQAMEAGSSLGRGAGQGYRALAGDYGSLAAASQQAGMMGGFQGALNSLFGTSADMSDYASRMRGQSEQERQNAWRTRAMSGLAGRTSAYDTQPDYYGAVPINY